jgi:hypothetical protein
MPFVFWRAHMTSLTMNYTSGGKRNVANSTKIFTKCAKRDSMNEGWEQKKGSRLKIN